MSSRRFLITGGSQGIGAALVAHARQQGHQVVFTGRNQTQIDAVTRDTGAVGVTADVSNDADNDRVVNHCVKQMGGIDVLINNAGVGYSAEIGSIEMGRMRSLFGTNVFGMVDLTNRVVPVMKGQASGDIVNLASTSGTKGAKGATVYAGSKWAVRGISQCWQAELRPHGIRVMHPAVSQTNWIGRAGPIIRTSCLRKTLAAIFARLSAENVLWPELAIFANNPGRN